MVVTCAIYSNKLLFQLNLTQLNPIHQHSFEQTSHDSSNQLQYVWNVCMFVLEQTVDSYQLAGVITCLWMENWAIVLISGHCTCVAWKVRKVYANE